MKKRHKPCSRRTGLALLLSILLLTAAFGFTCDMLAANAQDRAVGDVAGGNANDTLRVSLITCWPGPEIYELAGHEAIRVTSPSFDLVWNYGTFDFRQPNFVGRFVSGQTDYMVQAYPFAWFLPEYQKRGSKVVEQVLALTPEEKAKLLSNLSRNALPENATYRYNYVKDNCATRITAMLDTTLERRIVFPDTVRYGTFRRVMRAYHRDYPWYQLGIDLVLGSGLDYPVSRKAEMFVPVEMARTYAGARFAEEGGPVVAETLVLNEGIADPTLGPTPWYAGPTAVSVLTLLLTLVAFFWWRRTGKLLKWWFSLYFAACGLAGCLVAYLVFFSTHEATSPNLMLIWLNPFQLLFAVGIWWKSWKWVTGSAALYNSVAIPVLLLVWPWQSQSASLPILLFMANAPVLGIMSIIKTFKTSYIKIGREGNGNRSTPAKKGRTPRKRASKTHSRK